MIWLSLVFSGLVLTQVVVSDGDTLRDARSGQTYRIENLDAPEIGRAECPQERALGEEARATLRAWVERASTVEAFTVGRQDRYGREIASVSIDDVDLAEELIARGLARPWTGRKHDFCAELGAR